MDDLKQHQESHEFVKDVNDITFQSSQDTGACYGVSKCEKIAFAHGKMGRGEGLSVIDERMETMDLDNN